LRINAGTHATALGTRLKGRARSLVFRRLSAFTNQLVKCRHNSLFNISFAGRRFRRFICRTPLSHCPRLADGHAEKDTRHASAFNPIYVPGLASAGEAMIPPKLRKNLKLPNGSRLTTVAPSRLWGRSVSLPLARIPFTEKVARTVSARHALLTDGILGQTYVQLTSTAS
jgi:hypothetical protein